MEKLEFFNKCIVTSARNLHDRSYTFAVETPHEVVTLEIQDHMTKAQADKKVQDKIAESWENYRGQLYYD